MSATMAFVVSFVPISTRLAQNVWSLDKTIMGLVQFPLKSVEVFALTLVGAGSDSDGW